MQPKLLSLPTAGHLSCGLAERAGWSIADLEHRHFPDGESYVRLLESVDGDEVAVTATLHPPNEALMDAYLAAETARDLGAERVGLIAPYLGYLRQDRRFKEGEGVTSRYVAGLISNAFDWLATVDPHLHRLDSLAEIYRIPALSIAAAEPIGEWVAENVDRPMLIGPDDESEQWVAEVADVAGAPHQILQKERVGDRTVQVDTDALPESSERTPVVMDDIISSGGTMIETVQRLRQKGLRSPVCVGIHGLFAENAYDELRKSGAETVVTTNTVAHPSNAIDVTGVIAEAVGAFESANEPVATGS